MMKKPFFSIIVATYNAEKTILRCLESIKDQNFKDFELIIIDGKSKDKTVELIKDTKIKVNVFVIENDNGIYDAMNKGIKYATGEFIYFLNADDCFTDKNILNDVYKLVSKTTEKFDFITANVKKVYFNSFLLKNTKFSKLNLKFAKMPPHQAVFIKKVTFDEIGRFDSSFKSAADFELVCRLSKFNKKAIYFNKEIAFFYAGGKSSDKSISYTETYKIIKEYFGSFYANIYYINKILLEQSIKKLLISINLLADNKYEH